MLYYFKKCMLTYRYLHIYLKYSCTTLDTLKKPKQKHHPKTHLCLDSQFLLSKGTNLGGDSYQLQ